MQLDSYVRDVEEQLIASAALGDDRVREVAAVLAGAASPAVRLALLGVLAAAADELTAALLDSPGAPAVAVRLDSDEVRICVTTTAEATQGMRPDDADASARISLRLSEGLKAEIDSAATRAGVSVNTWLVRAAATAVGPAIDDPAEAAGSRDRGIARTHHITGWING